VVGELHSVKRPDVHPDPLHGEHGGAVSGVAKDHMRLDRKQMRCAFHAGDFRKAIEILAAQYATKHSLYDRPATQLSCSHFVGVFRMLTLGNIFVLMLLATGAAWVWHNHGLRERALARVKQHCAKLDIELLDGAVALKRIGFVKDANGRRRLARIYNFEFTVTGETRHSGTITQFGAHSAQIELAPYPFEAKEALPSAEVIELSQWRQNHATKNRQ
jgi:hypothetical protein